MQATRIRTRRHVTHSATIDGMEVELTFEPNYVDHILAERVGDKLVVAYLAHDDSPENPQQDGCANGDIYTQSSQGWLRDRSITDNDSEIESALGLDGYGGPDIDNEFEVEPGRPTTLRAIAARVYLNDVGSDVGLIEQWLDAQGLELEEGSTLDQAFNQHHDEILVDLKDDNGVFCAEVESLAVSMYHDYWQQIAGPFVVPLDYCSSNHGPGTMSINPTTWDGDPDDLPTGIWVADREAIDNIESSALPPGIGIRWHGAAGSVASPLHSVISKDGVDVFDAGVESGSWGRALAWAKQQYGSATPETLQAAAVEYAESICESYQAWCNGDVYGCVVEVFDKVGDDDDDWESDGDPDACWGFSGSDYALKSLKSDYFEPAVSRLRQVAA